jgi:hypothetical protein
LLQQTLCELTELPETHNGKEVVLQGDIWQLGLHRLMCGNSNLLVDVDKLVQKEKVYGLHDPPYGINLKYNYIKHPFKNHVADYNLNCFTDLINIVLTK